MKQYLRGIGVNPRGVVVQRGARNYAGPNCPGARWACTSTAHPVVQVAAPGGKNTFVCTSANCAVVQTRARGGRALAASKPPNTASCVKTTGLTQSCTISQTGAGPNSAYVYENAGKQSGLTQTALYTATITQQATAGKNTACVYQAVNIDGSTTALRGKPVAVTLRAHQTVTISQNSPGGNSASNASNVSGTSCDSTPLTQNQTLTSSANGTGPITQLENDSADPTAGENVVLTINQNPQSCLAVPEPTSCAAYTGANGINFSQTSNEVAGASGGQNAIPAGAAVTQTQSKPDGGIVATVNQFSKAQSSILGAQVENQCELAEVTGSLPATPASDPAGACLNPANHVAANQLPSILTQTQYGPIANAGGPARSTARRTLAGTKKGDGPSVQGDSPLDTFNFGQTTTQRNDTGQDQHQQNLVQGDCITSGTCNANQKATVNGTPVTQPTQSGQNVSSSINCTGASCPATPIIDSGPTLTSDRTTGSTSATFVFHDAYAAATFLCDLDGTGYSACSSPKNYTVTCASAHTFSVKATDTAGDLTLPATFKWTVPICPPMIDSGPSKPTDPSFSAAFTFHDGGHTTGTVPTFQCDLDGTGYSGCSSPKSYTVTCGAHTFSVTEGDQYGDTSAATTWSWTVANICFDGSPGTGTPPGTLGGYAMTAFGTDPQPLGDVSGVTDPAGTISFSPNLHHDTVPNGGWNNWSNGYTGDVYDTCFDNGSGCTAVDPSHVRIMLPAGTNAFYFYSEANTYNTFTLQATADNGTTSGPVQVTTPGGAKYFGFFGTGGVNVAYVDVTANDPLGFAVGEFGINTSP